MKRPPRGSYGEPPKTLDTLGKRIRRVRLAWDWTQTQFANAVHSNQKTLSHWERDRQEPSEAALGAIAQLFGLTPEAIRTGKGFRVPEPPRQFTGLLVAETLATDLVQLPSVGKTGLLLMHREDETALSVTPRKLTDAIRKAQREGRPVWVIIG